MSIRSPFGLGSSCQRGIRVLANLGWLCNYARYEGSPSMNAWYTTLNRPPLTPPDWIFGPVWTALYITIALSVYRYYRSAPQTHRGVTSAVLIVHLVSNFAWTSLFFGLQSPGLALIDIAVLDLTLAVLIGRFWKTNVLAGALLIPYSAWVAFATYLNLGFFKLN
jgi:translocator protein